MAVLTVVLAKVLLRIFGLFILGVITGVLIKVKRSFSILFYCHQVNLD